MANILVVGSGAREHVLAKQLLDSDQVENVYCAPGNPGMLADEIQTVDIEELAFTELIEFAHEQDVDLTVVGPELPLQQGIVDAFQAANLRVFGPNAAAAQLEGSKKFAKQIMMAAGVPTGAYQAFTDEQTALTYLKTIEFPIVIKANGLAAGKGVVIAHDLHEAGKTIHDLLGEHEFDTSEVIIEEFLQGQEFSLMAFVNGDQIVPMPLSQDHKAAFDGDIGPNTGGMGAYSPLPQFDDELENNCLEQIIRPVVETMVNHGIPFTGVLYAGLILTDQGPKVIEFNVRFGDPETMVVLPQLKSDLYDLLIELLRQQPVQPIWQSDGIRLAVGLSAKSYPQSSDAGVDLMEFSSAPDDLNVWFAGTKKENNILVSDGGRILSVETGANSIREAQNKIYGYLAGLSLDGLRYRHDIGDKGL